MAATFNRKAYPEASAVKRSILRLYDLAKVDTQIAAHLPIDDVKTAFKNPDATLFDMVDFALRAYADRDALGERAYEVISGVREHRAEFETLKYGALQDRIKNLANAWKHHPDHKVGVDEFVCMVGFSGIDYVSLDLACIYAQTTGVPLQAELGAGHLDGYFQEY